MPPPSTPAQRRFLPPKRHAPQSQSQSQTQKQTPTQHQGGPHQFASTPRFNVSATSSSRAAAASNQPPVFSTPAPPAAARQWSTQRGTQYEPLDDAIDTSPISSAAQEDEEHQDHHNSLSDSIEIDSPSAPRSSLGREDRPTKRRRVSVSPETDAIPDYDEENDDRMEVSDGEPTEEYISVFSEEEGEEKNAIASQSPSILGDAASESDEPESPSPAEPSKRHPTFHKAPRFKATELAEGAQRGVLPDAFSPQRRGARYVPGGLAAELREWLVQVKGASEYDRPVGSSIEVVVDEAKSGNGMWLVAAHERDDAGRQKGGDLVKVVLAGDGRISGLRGRKIVRQGTTVSLHQPMWDINLNDLGQFAVACDWEIPD